jgi:hypothetical protein
MELSNAIGDSLAEDPDHAVIRPNHGVNGLARAVIGLAHVVMPRARRD